MIRWSKEVFCLTEKLYDIDSHLREFSAHVVSCRREGERYAVVLSRTAFFPEGGGQAADTGTLGEARVLDVRLWGDQVEHLTDAPVPEGSRVRCSLDWDRRFRRMQEHSGEHIISGTVHRLYGYDNVGFHMGESGVTIDFSGELSDEQLTHVEAVANLTVWRNLPVRTGYPSPEELRSIDYRSKKELDGPVRLVYIEGVDCCACCAPHVYTTGEIGVIKLLSAERHRGGMRLTAVCGADALEDYRARQVCTREISNLLSVPQLETPAAVRRLLGETEELKRRLVEAQREALRCRVAALPQTQGALCLFEGELDGVSQRETVNAGMERSAVCALFVGAEGDWKYIIGSKETDLRAAAKAINAAISGRGGGSPTMIQGSAAATRADIEAYFAHWGEETE